MSGAGSQRQLFFRCRFENVVPACLYPLLPAVLELYEREARFVFRQQFLKILKVYFDGFAIGIFEFHASIIESANAGSRVHCLLFREIE